MAGLTDVNTVLDAIARAADALAPDVSRVAAFDADGTLWGSDIGEQAFVRGAPHIDATLVDARVRPLAERWGVALPDDVEGTLGALQTAIDDGRLKPHLSEVYQLNAWVFAGRTDAELMAFGREIFAECIADTVFDHVEPILKGLERLEIRPVIVSASHESFARAGGVQLGFEANNIFGMLPKTDANGRFVDQMERVTFGDGKHTCLQQECGGPALAAFGDSPAGNDKALLGGAQVAVAIGPTGADLDAATEGEMWVLPTS